MDVYHITESLGGVSYSGTTEKECTLLKEPHPFKSRIRRWNLSSLLMAASSANSRRAAGRRCTRSVGRWCTDTPRSGCHRPSRAAMGIKLAALCQAAAGGARKSGAAAGAGRRRQADTRRQSQRHAALRDSGEKSIEYAYGITSVAVECGSPGRRRNCWPGIAATGRWSRRIISAATRPSARTPAWRAAALRRPTARPATTSCWR